MKTTKKFNKILEKSFLNRQNSWTQDQFLKIRIIHAIAILLEWYCLNLRSKFMLPQNQICED